MNNNTIYCPECNTKMHKMGTTWSGRNKVQRYRCPRCGRTHSPVIDKPVAVSIRPVDMEDDVDNDVDNDVVYGDE